MMNSNKEKDDLTSYIESGGKKPPYDELKESVLQENSAISDFASLPYRCLLGGFMVGGLVFIAISIHDKSPAGAVCSAAVAGVLMTTLAIQTHRYQSVVSDELLRDSSLKRRILNKRS